MSLTPDLRIAVSQDDRAARSVTDMIDIDAALREANVAVVFVREGVDTSSPTGQFFRNICASVAQFEGKLMGGMASGVVEDFGVITYDVAVA